jgi:hypothetical protein
MNRIKFLSIFVLVALLVSVGSGVTMAQEPPLEDSLLPNLPGLDDPVSEWTDDDLEQLVDLIVSERITVQESQVISEQLTEEQITKVGELLAVRVGIPLDEAWQAMAERREKDISGSCSTSTSSRGYLWPGGCYPCEYAGACVRNPTLANYHGYGKECGSSDADWLPHFPIDYEQNPDQLRWYTDDGRVYWCIYIFDGLNLNSFAYDWAGWGGGVWLVVGTTAASCAGGIDRVEDHQYLALLCN